MMMISHIFCFLMLLFGALFALSAAQYYNPYNTPSPTFSSLNNNINNPYYYPTQNPYNPYQTASPYNPYQTASPYNYQTGQTGTYNDYQIRIWPYVIGQYLYPTYYNNNNYNPYASLSTPNWQSYYQSVYNNNLGKK